MGEAECAPHVFPDMTMLQSTSSPVEIQLLAGHEAKENFVVTY